MRKFELEDKLIEQQQSTNIIERLTLHVDKMWEEIGEKNTKIYEMRNEIYELRQQNKKMSDALRKFFKEKKDDAMTEKEIMNLFQTNRTDN
ncbi:MAG: hypothetical protein ACXAAH_16960 [Promethearchaeota archaeon]|jgi:Mg2+ and Co2+ transporter CorA